MHERHVQVWCLDQKDDDQGWIEERTWHQGNASMMALQQTHIKAESAPRPIKVDPEGVHKLAKLHLKCVSFWFSRHLYRDQIEVMQKQPLDHA